MSAEEMASDVRKSENAQIRKEALKESERGQHMTKVRTSASCKLDTLCTLMVLPQPSFAPLADSSAPGRL